MAPKAGSNQCACPSVRPSIHPSIHPSRQRFLDGALCGRISSKNGSVGVFFLPGTNQNKGIMSMCNILVVLSWITPLYQLMVSDGNKVVAQPMSVILCQSCKEIIT